MGRTHKATARVEPVWGEGSDIARDRFFDQSLDLLCLASVDGYFKTVNAAWSQTLGHTVEELTSRPYLDFVHPHDRAATLAEASKLELGFPTVHFTNRYRCGDGSYRWLAWTATAADANGLIYASARDITGAVLAADEQARLSEQRARVQGAFEDGALSMVYQPIVSLAEHRLCGMEALARFTLEPTRPPDRWFAEAAGLGLRVQLEAHAIRSAVSAIDRIPDHAFLSVNASPETLVSSEFAAAIASTPTNRLVVEVTEHSVVTDYDRLRHAVSDLRQRGVRLAIDDAGAGYSSLSHIVQLVPDFIKLDVFLTHNVDTDPVRQALVGALVSFAWQINATLIAEGVETEGELRFLERLKFGAVQGYFVGRPAPLS